MNDMTTISAAAIKGEEHWTTKDGDVKLFMFEKCAGDPKQTAGTILFVHGSSMAAQPTFDLQAFRKIVFFDEASFARWHGKVSNVAGICEVMEAVDPTTLVQRAGAHRWVLGVVEHALACIERTAGSVLERTRGLHQSASGATGASRPTSSKASRRLTRRRA